MFFKMLICFSRQLRILCIGGKAGRGVLRPAPESVEKGLPYGRPNGLLYGLPFGLPYSLPLVSRRVSRPQSVARRLSYGLLLFRGLSYDLRYALPLVSRMVSRPESVVRPLLYGLPYGLTNVPLNSWPSSGSCITLLSPLVTLPAPECVERSPPYGLPEVSRMVSRLVP